mmetsp:Transcript_98723/g.156075  ORF Transcript_98723/g.156075 Transcript_98723/m.156075 type:complete len:277 (+) Transcript_98723:36-866(+)|eukprot:CAMPEP_0169113874 /NCGR_PEP_ID=MMETSP1015-20121227/28444_1 /TAXON_ID=342587 /ORGANISM="Karlodinium micrum, Strain CCMP2283" /LENGTH=276 /DNA_ID=CAMNT_0009176093 /DNA_START=36 /DNA_END=866 /DNA_ORIENTATION=+
MRRLTCLGLFLISLSFCCCEEDLKSESENDSKSEQAGATAAAVVRAVNEAESKHDANKEDKEAGAVADATMGVIKSESDASDIVPEEVLAKAKGEAIKTFKQLDKADVGTKVAADAAAKVELAEVDGASGLNLKKDVKENAEKAAVAAGKGLADHPDNGLVASLDAVSTVAKELKTGKVDVAKKSLVSKAKDAVEDLPSMTEGAVRNTTHKLGALPLLVVLGIVAIFGYRAYKDHYEETPYMKSLRLIREEYQEGSDHRQKDTEFGDLDSQYTEMR